MTKDRPSKSNSDGDSTTPSQGRKLAGGDEPKRRRGFQPRSKAREREFPSRFQSSPESPETEVSDVAKRFEYSKGVQDIVNAVTGEQPYATFERVTPVVSISALFDYLCQSTYRYVELRSMREPLFTLEELDYTYRYILALRLAQVSGAKLPEGVRPAEVRYPALLGPLLACIGRYVHPTATLELVPSIDPRMSTWEGMITVGSGPNSFTPN